MNKNNNWFEDTPVLANLSPNEAAIVLRELGEIDTALSLEKLIDNSKEIPAHFGMLDLFNTTTKPWMYAAHTFGFLPQNPGTGKERQIESVGQITPDYSLKKSRIKISLNRLRVASYPGGGTHTILFDFYAQNQVVEGAEDVHFNSAYRVEDGSQAGIVGYPIFIGLGVGTEGVSFKCFTVNVKNNDDEKFISVLESNVFKKGLKLATTFQPALGPLSELAVTLTKSIASRHRNVAVQDFYLGLDFGGTGMGARLAQGDYIAVQIPMELQRVWSWNEWEYDINSGQILNKFDGSYIPFNYIVFGVTKYEGL